MLVGEADHPEVQGIYSYASGEAIVIASGAEARALPNNRKIGIVALLAIWCLEIIRPFLLPTVWGVIIAIGLLWIIFGAIVVCTMTTR